LWSFSHFEKEFIEKDMNPGDTAEILSTIANYDTIESGVLPTYRFEISYNNRSRNFNQEQFLDLLKKTKKDGHVWIINDASLCP
jgi:thiamine biosynthesis protein ThiC